MTETPCPVCGAVGTETCVKGQKDTDRWQFKEPFPEGHAARNVHKIIPKPKRLTWKQRFLKIKGDEE